MALQEEGVIREDLADKFEDMARFRNLLVHRCEEIDGGRVLEIIKQNLGDIGDFEAEIERFVKTEGGE